MVDGATLPSTKDASPSSSSRVFVVARDAARLSRYAPLIRHLHVTGFPVTVTAWSTPRPWGLPPDIEMSTTPDPDLAWLPSTDLLDVVAVDDEARAVVLPRERGLSRLLHRKSGRAADRPGLSVSGPERLGSLVLSDLAARPALKPSDADTLEAALAALRGHGIASTTIRELARRLLAGAHWSALAALTSAEVESGSSRSDRALMAVLNAVALLNLGTPVKDVSATVAEALGAADEVSGVDPTAAQELTAAALRLLFHRELHAAADRSTLVSDPSSVTELMARSEVLAPLLAPTSTRLRPPDPGAGTVGRPRAVVLPGAYPNFSADVEAALSRTHEVVRHDLGDAESRFHNTEAESITLTQLLAGGVSSALPWEGAQLVFADWADKAAALASRTVGPSTRLVVRCHGVDTLSVWMHFIDWARVDTVICVSEHVRRTLLGLRGDRLRDTEVVVVPPGLDVDTLPGDKTPGSRHMLGMIGWGQRVKDPLFALDVLGVLRQQDPSWQLTLIGPDFVRPGSVPEAEYQAATRARILDPDVRGGLTFTGRLAPAQVREVLPTIGIGLSTSRRESFHLGAAELMGSGSLPVIRDWPMYAGQSGAAGVFPPDAVVATVDEAVARIRSLSVDPGWAERSAAARAWMVERYSPTDLRERLTRAVLGS